MISALMSVHRVSLLTVLMDIAQYQTAVNGCKKKKKKRKEIKRQLSFFSKEDMQT